MKKWFLLLLLYATQAPAQQRLTLDGAIQEAMTSYPLVKQKDLVKQTEALSLDNISKGYLPQVTLSGQATYQSDVTQVKVPVPGINIEPPNKDQYRLVADVNQLIYDGGVLREQKNVQQLNTEVEQQKVAVELYRVKERVNQLFLSVLYLDEQLKQVELVKADLDNGIRKVEAQVANGVAFRSNVSLLKAELLKAGQRTIELQSTRKGLIETLGLFLNRTLDENTRFEQPAAQQGSKEDISRPELKLYSLQQKLVLGQNNLIDAKNKPRASVFVQGGYGRPGLNLLKNEFAFFYTTGLRLNWSLSGLYTRKNEKQQLNINKMMLDVQQETFLLNTRTQLSQQNAEIEKLQKLLATDDEIIALRVSVKDAAKAQLENGVITANDYLREVNAEDQSRQTRITHQLQLLQAQINYQTILGK